MCLKRVTETEFWKWRNIGDYWKSSCWMRDNQNNWVIRVLEIVCVHFHSQIALKKFKGVFLTLRNNIYLWVMMVKTGIVIQRDHRPITEDSGRSLKRYIFLTSRVMDIVWVRRGQNTGKVNFPLSMPLTCLRTQNININDLEVKLWMETVKSVRTCILQ